MANNTKDNTSADELRQSIEEKFSEYSIHPQETHEEGCGFWGNEDGEGVEYCDCRYSYDVRQFAKCMPEIMQLITSYTKQRELALLERLEKQWGETVDYSLGKRIYIKFVPLSAIQKEKEKL